MIRLRLTVLKDRPDPDKLRKFGQHGYRIFRDKGTELYYLFPPDPERPEDPFAGFYDDHVLTIKNHYDTSFLKNFKRANKKLLKGIDLHDYVVEDALSVSDIFKTRVLSAYSNDENCDFVSVAENGKLLRLRFSANREIVRKLSLDEAQSIETESSFVRVYPEEDNDAVFEYVKYEAIQTETSPLHLARYSRYIEGEIGKVVVFKNLSWTPESIKPNLMFRNVYVEFLEAFGKPAPDFLVSTEDFELIETFTPDNYAEEQSKLERYNRIFGYFMIPVFIVYYVTTTFTQRYLKKNDDSWNIKNILMLTVIVATFMSVIFSKEEKPKVQKLNFSDHCTKVGGHILEKTTNLCGINGKTFTKLDLPYNEEIVKNIAVRVSPNTILCEVGSVQTCLEIENKAYSGTIEGYEHQEGVGSLLVLTRTQLCDVLQPGDCDGSTTAFTYKAIRSYDIPQKP